MLPYAKAVDILRFSNDFFFLAFSAQTSQFDQERWEKKDLCLFEGK